MSLVITVCMRASVRRLAEPLTDRRDTRDAPPPHRGMLRLAAARHPVLRTQVRRLEAEWRPDGRVRSRVSRRPRCRPAPPVSPRRSIVRRAISSSAWSPTTWIATGISTWLPASTRSTWRSEERRRRTFHREPSSRHTSLQAQPPAPSVDGDPLTSSEWIQNGQQRERHSNHRAHASPTILKRRSPPSFAPRSASTARARVPPALPRSPRAFSISL